MWRLYRMAEHHTFIPCRDNVKRGWKTGKENSSIVCVEACTLLHHTSGLQLRQTLKMHDTDLRSAVCHTNYVQIWQVASVLTGDLLYQCCKLCEDGELGETGLPSQCWLDFLNNQRHNLSLTLKGEFTQKSKAHISPLTCRAVYQSR